MDLIQKPVILQLCNTRKPIPKDPANIAVALQDGASPGLLRVSALDTPIVGLKARLADA